MNIDMFRVSISGSAAGTSALGIACETHPISLQIFMSTQARSSEHQAHQQRPRS